MGLTTPSQSLTHPSLSINPNPIPPWQIEMIRLGDVTCIEISRREKRWRVKMKKRRIEKKEPSSLSTIPEKDKSSVDDLVPIPSGSKGISDNICDNFDAESLLSRDIPITSPKIDFLSEEFAGELAPILPDIHEADFDEEEDICDDDTSSDDDDFEDIEYVDATPPNSELVSLEEVEDVILRDKLSNVYLLISKIETLNDNPTLSSFSNSDNSFSDHMEETRSSSTTTHANNSLPEYDSFLIEIEPNQEGLISVVM
ncbi:hypothetical protein Tco_0664428 [Tanacetum coccineum]